MLPRPEFALRLSSLLMVFGLMVFGALAGVCRSGAHPQNPQPPQEQRDKDKAGEVTVPLPSGTKLFMKDGTFHLVRSYEIKGERVRYWSVERSAWEEIPTEMVDWDATHKGEDEAAAHRREIDANIKSLEKKQGFEELDVDASLEIAPGVFLPGGVGLFVVEGKSVAALTQAQAESKLNKKRFLAQVMVPIPVIPSQHKVDLPGERAVLRVTANQPEFYFRTADGREPQVQLIRAKLKGKTRELGAINTNIAGQSSTNINAIALERWEAARGVFRFTLGQNLAAGEYAFVEFVPGEGMNLYVWDFGVDPVGSSPAAKR
jgi:hypothetical protein